MLKKSSYNTCNCNIVCIAFYSSHHTAYASYDHIYLNTTHRGLNKLFYDSLISKRVNLYTYISFFTILSLFNLIIDKLKNLILKALRCNKQMFCMFNYISKSKIIEHICCFSCNIYIRGNKRKVCVELGCLFVKVTCSNVSYILKVITIFICYKA